MAKQGHPTRLIDETTRLTIRHILTERGRYGIQRTKYNIPDQLGEIVGPRP